ncbi:hypothetical protein PFISCL1PPCAC_18380, partial [Pristionchus fissidentatus]
LHLLLLLQLVAVRRLRLQLLLLLHQLSNKRLVGEACEVDEVAVQQLLLPQLVLHPTLRVILSDALDQLRVLVQHSLHVRGRVEPRGARLRSCGHWGRRHLTVGSYQLIL